MEKSKLSMIEIRVYSNFKLLNQVKTLSCWLHSKHVEAQQINCSDPKTHTIELIL